MMKRLKYQKPPEILDKDYIGLNGVGLSQLKHPHFEIWQTYLREHYSLEKEKKLIIFIPCAAIKPYNNSPIHKIFNKVIDKFNNTQKFVISNAGIIPYEFCHLYPFNSYDWNPLLETNRIKDLYIKITTKRIFEFFKSKIDIENYDYISYLRNSSESMKAIEHAFNKLDLNLDIIHIKGELHKTADHDLLLILPENLKKLEKTIMRKSS
ncbi:MAG: hypothetical protein GF311_20610 [Candidatus Lokiarchaeota archaeon]|nr:hypothetical protein [Candidatus Lokiarchaeota archaeon]